MERNLAFVGTVGNNAPFVGLLGTVIGIIRAFHELDQSGGQVSSGLMMIKARLGRGQALASEVLAYLKSTRLTKEAPTKGDEG